MSFHLVLKSEGNEKSDLKLQLALSQVIQGTAYEVGVESVYLRKSRQNKVEEDKEEEEEHEQEQEQEQEQEESKLISIFLEELEFPLIPLLEHLQTDHFFKCHNIVYAPFSSGFISRLHVKLRNEGNLLELKDHVQTFVKLHLRPRTNMRFLRASSVVDRYVYPANNPLNFRFAFPAYPWNSIDFSKWEIALHSLYVPKVVLKNLALPEQLSVVNVFTDVILEGQVSGIFMFALDDLALPGETSGDYFYFEVPKLSFHNFVSKHIDDMSVFIRANYAVDVDQILDEHKHLETVCTLCLRKKDPFSYSSAA